ncbi:MAG: S8 family serine peptidase [Bacteroidia bacterium]|nr:S8 family serine peptidase [Bacteroidia bacterium]
MKSRLIFIFLSGLLQLVSAQGFSPDSTRIDSYVLRQMGENPDFFIRVYIYLEEQVDILSLEQNFRKQHTSLEVRGKEVVTRLQTTAKLSQKPILNWLQNRTDLQPFSIRPFWIANVVFLSAKPSLITALSHRPDIQWIGYDVPAEPDETYGELEAAASPNGHEAGLSAINAPALWAMGYSGYGRSVFSIDTGVDPTHPALAQRFRGNYVPAAQAWFDDSTHTSHPFVCVNDFGVRQDHGTHTTGIIVGFDPNTHDTIGVAPQGLWMGAPAICDLYSSDNIAAFQWALDPDGNPATTADMPDVINNSWRTIDIGDACNHPAYTQSLNALEAAGIAVVFSAGNEGPSAGSISPPKGINTGLVNTFAVGSINGNLATFPISSFSGRGPSVCPGLESLLIKPEVVAPGVQVRSSILNGKYGTKSGTSMAAPHVSGAILLLKEAFPYLTGEEIKLALYFTCTDLGAPGEDNSYGMGLINLSAAWQFLVAAGNVPVIPSDTNNVAVVSVENIPQISCDSLISPIIHWQNLGENPVFSAVLDYTFSNGLSGSMLLNDSLFQDSAASVFLPAFTFSPGLYTLEVNLRNPNGENDYRHLDNYKRISFSISPPPPVIAVDTVCMFSEGMLTAMSPMPGTVIRWYDSLTNGNLLAEGNFFITPTLSSDQVYYVTAEWPSDEENQCPRKTVEVNVAPDSMQASFVADFYQVFLPDSATVTFTDQSSGALAWNWRFGDGEFSTLQNPVHTYTMAGVYRVILSAEGQDGCTDVFQDTVVVLEKNVSTEISESEEGFDGHIHIYPNPSSGIVFVNVFLPENQPSNLVIYDVNGREIFIQKDIHWRIETLEFDFTGHAPGIYYLTFRTTNGTLSKKIIISP